MATLPILNVLRRRLDLAFPGFFQIDTKHNHYRDFGFPRKLTFEQFHSMYRRNGIAFAAIEKTISKTWQDTPLVLEQQRDGAQGVGDKETPLEADIRQKFDDLNFWNIVIEADRRAMVGGYAGVIFRFADDRPFSEPVERVSGGLDGIVEVIPAWKPQLTVSEWDDNPLSETYGKPLMFEFNEAAVGSNKAQSRQLTVHPDRVVVWSVDGTIYPRSCLEHGYNDLLTAEKICGAGGEGFWKTAKAAPVIEVGADTSLEKMAKYMGVAIPDIADKMSEQVDSWQKGFDQLLMLQGMQAKPQNIQLQSPQYFFNIAVQGFAASMSIPLKILLGSQTGERASTEDADEWSKTNMARRTGICRPRLMTIINRLERVGILPENDWYLDWSDLTESSPAEKIDRAGKMADINQKLQTSGEWVFTPDEIRAVADYEPLSADVKYRDATSAADAAAAAGVPTNQGDNNG